MLNLILCKLIYCVKCGQILMVVVFFYSWATCSDPLHWPYSWSPKLMATSLATEPWRDGKWMKMM